MRYFTKYIPKHQKQAMHAEEDALLGENNK
jgi:hypothetical protein